jgi:hypothetical protein
MRTGTTTHDGKGETMNQQLLECDRDTHRLIAVIVKRLRDEIPTLKPFDSLSLAMDLTVCHNLGHVNLSRLARMHIGDLGHDVGGIHRHLDRHTGELGECFVPRCGRRQDAKAN